MRCQFETCYASAATPSIFCVDHLRVCDCDLRGTWICVSFFRSTLDRYSHTCFFCDHRKECHA